MKQSVKRWVYVINVLRAIPYDNLKNKHLEIEGLKLNVRRYSDGRAVVAHDKDVLIVFGEDGYPDYLSDWAKAPVQWEPYDFPMYE